MDIKYDNCGKKFKESIASLIKAIAKQDKRKDVEDIFKQFWQILTMVLSLSFFHGNPDSVLDYYNTKVNELLKEASELHQCLKYPKLTKKSPFLHGQESQEESVALKVEWFSFLKNIIGHLRQATINKCKIEDLERDLREELGVLKGLDAEFYSYFDVLTFSKEPEKKENLCKMQQAAQAFFNIDDPSLFESLLKEIWMSQDHYLKHS